jgi:hypothetical protein
MITHASLPGAWVVYKMFAPALIPNPNTAFFIGCCQLQSLASTPDAYSWKVFRETMEGHETITETRLSIVAMFETEDQATDMQSAIAQADNTWINLNSPRCDPPARRGSKAMNVREIATGAVFPSASSVAKMLNVSGASMSLHLNGHLPHIRGRRFERVK